MAKKLKRYAYINARSLFGGILNEVGVISNASTIVLNKSGLMF